MNSARHEHVAEAPDRQRELPFPLEEGKPPTKPSVKVRRRWGGWLLGLVALLVLGAALAYGAWRYTSQERDVLATAQQQRDLVPSVRVATVTASPPIIVTNLPGTTLGFTSANIFARVSGYIDKRNVDIGDRVKKDQLLATIYAPEIEHQLAGVQSQLVLAKMNLTQAQANRDLAQITWDRDRPLVEKGWLPEQQGSIDQQNLKAQEAAVAVALANVNVQEAQLKVVTQQRAYQSVIAPFDGVVTQRNVDVGDLLQADTASNGTFLFTVTMRDVIRTQVYVPQDQAVGLAPGVNATIRVPEMPNRTFQGKVTRLADALQPGSRTLLTEIDIPNPDKLLTPGIYCTIELQVPRKTTALLVPSQALIFNRDGMQVAVVEDGVAHIRRITIVRDFGTEVEASTGVHAGDKVILNPSVNLADGSKVKPRPQTSQQARQ